MSSYGRMHYTPAVLSEPKETGGAANQSWAREPIEARSHGTAAVMESFP